MTETSCLFQRNIIITILRALICFTFLKPCIARNSFYDLDLSTQTLNPVATGFMVTGNAAGDSFGRRLNTAGDINNDGYDDIIIGAPYKNNFQGAVYVIYGGEESSFLNIDLSVTTLDPLTTGFTITGSATGDYFGLSVSTAGDINHDGYDDIVIGAYGKNTVYVIYGGAKSTMSNWDFSSGATLTPSTTGFKITGSAITDYFGQSVSTAGDINNDGYDDIIIGAPIKNAAYVIYGGAKASMSNIVLSSTTLVPTSTGFMITGNAAGDNFGGFVSTTGDINNDGYDDIIVGVREKNNLQGAAYVIYGGEKLTRTNIVLSSTTLDPSTTGFVITGNALGDYFGFSVSTAGDINNDGYDDIIIGAPYKNSYQGAAYVIYGGEKLTRTNIDLSVTTLDPLTTGFTITGSAAGDYFGFSVSTAGDINNDGYDDIIIGAPYKNSLQGTAYVIYGGAKSTMSSIVLSSTTLDPFTTGFAILGNAVGDYLGFWLNIAGDINNDGYDDIIVGAPYKNSLQGTAYVIYESIASCSVNCKQCSSESVCIECKSPYLLYQSECLDSCPFRTFTSTDICKDCPAHCFYCTSQDACIVCSQGYTLSNSLCVLSFTEPQTGAQEKASKIIASATQGIGSVICVGSAVFPFSALVSKIVQNTRYLNLSVTSDLAEVYQTWQTDLISWDVPNVMSDLDHFETSPYLFAQYNIDSPFLVNFWPSLINIAIGFGTFIACILIKRIFEHEKYEGWAYSLVLKLVAGSFNFALIQAYACLDDILFYLVLDAKTNHFNSFFSWASMICAVVFLAFGCLQVFFNFWTVCKYQSIKHQGQNNIEAFNERNKYWELFYSDFNDDDLWSQSFFAIAIIRSALSSFIITVLYDYPLMQTAYLIIMDGVIILFLYFKSPFNTLRGKLAQYYYEIITLLVHICAFILALQDSFDHSSATVRLIMSTGILYLNTALISGAIGFMFIEIYKTISEKNRAARLKKRQSVPEDNQESQSLTRTASALQLPETDPPKRQDWINQQSIEKISFFPRNNQKLNSDFMNLKSSQGPLESNFNADHSREPDMYPSNSINQHGNQSPRPIMIRHRQQVQSQPKTTGKQFHASKA